VHTRFVDSNSCKRPASYQRTRNTDCSSEGFSYARFVLPLEWQEWSAGACVRRPSAGVHAAMFVECWLTNSHLQ